MTIARSTGAFTGTSESSGDTITNNSTDTGSEVDVLGDNASAGEVELYLVVTSTVTAGTLDVTINKRRVTGQAYAKLAPDFSIAPINGTQLVPLGRVSAARYMQVSVKNNGTGASATNACVLYELFKFSEQVRAVSQLLAYTDLDVDCPINWDWEPNEGLAAEWAATAVSGWRGVPSLRNLVRGGRPPNPADGTLGGGASWQNPSNTPAILATGGGYVALPMVATANSASNSMTLVITFFPSTWTGTFTALCDDLGRQYSIFVNTSGNLSFQGSMFPNFNAGGMVAGKLWQLTFTMNPAADLMYVNGMQVQSVAGSGVAMAATLHLGDNPSGGGSLFNGYYYNVQHWPTRSLSAISIGSLYDQMRRGNPDRWRWLSRTAWLLPSSGGGGTAYTVNVTDVCGTVEAAGRSLTAFRHLTESPLTGESCGRSGAFRRALNEAPLTGETAARLFSGTRHATETPQTVETPARTLAGLRSVSDAPATVETPARVFSGLRSVTEAPLTSESMAANKGKVIALSDAPATVEAPARQWSGTRTVVDTPLTAETPATQRAYQRHLTDLVTTAEIAAASKSRLVSVSDAPATAEVVARQWSGTRAVADALLSVESLTTSRVLLRGVVDVWLTTEAVTGIVIVPGAAVGPFYVSAACVFVPGAQAACVFTAGAQAAEVLI